MALIDIQENTGRRQAGPSQDHLGLGLFIFHIAISFYILLGWLGSPALPFYLVLLPAIALQWYVNRGSCIVNNIESLLRSGRWRDPGNPEEAGFLRMLCEWRFGTRPSPATLDRISYLTVLALWLLGFGHYAWLTLG